MSRSAPGARGRSWTRRTAHAARGRDSAGPDGLWDRGTRPDQPDPRPRIERAASTGPPPRPGAIALPHRFDPPAEKVPETLAAKRRLMRLSARARDGRGWR